MTKNAFEFEGYMGIYIKNERKKINKEERNSNEIPNVEQATFRKQHAAFQPLITFPHAMSNLRKFLFPFSPQMIN